MTAKHTPGPWTVALPPPGAVGAGDSLPFWIDAEGRRVADVRTQGGDSAANARLIAAAPDMLAALDALMSATESLQGYIPAHLSAIRDETQSALVRARAAIAKARGE